MGSSSVDVDAKGWVKSVKPGQGLFTQCFNATDGNYPKGDYILLYDGEGDLSPGDDAVAVGTATKTGNTTRQVIRVTQPTSKGISLGLTSVNPNNYVRNIRVIMLGGGCTGSIDIPPVQVAVVAQVRMCRLSRFTKHVSSAHFISAELPTTARSVLLA